MKKHHALLCSFILLTTQFNLDCSSNFFSKFHYIPTLIFTLYALDEAKMALYELDLSEEEKKVDTHKIHACKHAIFALFFGYYALDSALN